MIIKSLNPILRLNSIIPEGIYQNSPKFIEFLKAYYEWLHTTELEISDTVGTYTLGEYIVGQTSKSTAKILQIKENKIIVLIESSLPFQRGESISGQTSSATSNISSIKDNILRSSANLISYRDLNLSVDKFSDYLKYEFYSSIPSSVSGDKIFLAKKVRDIYKSKGQEQAYKFLFKSLFNQDIEIIYPGQEILRISDGKFSQKKVIRAVITSNIFDFLFKTIRGSVSNAIANVVDIKLVFIDSIQVAEMTLTLVSGTFLGNETIYDINNTSILTTLYGVISGFTINNPGTGYQENDLLNINGDGVGAVITIGAVFQSPIDAIKVNSIGYGYRLNTYANVNNTGTDGSGLIIKVTKIEDSYDITSGANTYTVGTISEIKILNKGSNYRNVPLITLEDSTIKNLGLLTDGLFTIVNAGNNYTVNDWLSFSAPFGSGANAIVSSVTEANTTLVLEDESAILLETKSYLKNQTATFVGPIRKIEMTNFGSGYLETDLPTITINTSTGSSANIICTGIQGTGANVQVDIANNTSGIGSIRTITINDFGANYSYANVNASVLGNGDANLVPIISGIGISKGELINDDGKLDYKKIQDSYYYQDFSYVIKSDLDIENYKEVVKNILHPAGLEFFEEVGVVRIVSPIDLSLRIETEISTVKLKNLLIQIISSFDASINSVDLLYLKWEAVPIYRHASNTISTYSSITFNTSYANNSSNTYDSVTTYTKLTGTVNTYSNNVVIGTGTLFNIQVANGDFLLVGNDQLKVSSVSSNTLLTVTVSSNTNYTNSIAYAT